MQLYWGDDSRNPTDGRFAAIGDDGVAGFSITAWAVLAMATALAVVMVITTTPQRAATVDCVSLLER
jgi:hypothetical protein